MFAEQLNAPYFKCTVTREEVLIWGSIRGNDEVIEAQIQRDKLRTIVQTRGNRPSKHSSSQGEFRRNGNWLLEMFKKAWWSHKERAPATSPENLLAEMSRCSKAKQLPKEGIATEKLLDNCWRCCEGLEKLCWAIFRKL
ncbi:uncharacterized protein LOC133876863 [Alnus glutinosa]|uniref:uncharacterized protein LOC133876863 n=1 Tax=Alnus glutinosa TaxID=3517 RepID=UPI002D78482A|nr:uncharacterized protein LOC133876863 [Alnus glutinosa]